MVRNFRTKSQYVITCFISKILSIILWSVGKKSLKKYWILNYLLKSKVTWYQFLVLHSLFLFYGFRSWLYNVLPYLYLLYLIICRMLRDVHFLLSTCFFYLILVGNKVKEWFEPFMATAKVFAKLLIVILLNSIYKIPVHVHGKVIAKSTVLAHACNLMIFIIIYYYIYICEKIIEL